MRTAALILLFVAGLAAADPQLAALESQAASPQDFKALVARLDAQGRAADALLAHRLQCRNLIGRDAVQARAVTQAGLIRAQTVPAPAAHSGLLSCLGYLDQQAGDSRKALQAYDAAVARAQGDAKALADAQAFRGELHYERGHLHAALVDLQAAHAAYVKVGELNQQRYVRTALANLYADSRIAEYEKALEIYAEQLQRHQQDGRAGDEATAHFNIGSTLRRAGRFAEAATSLRAALTAYERLNDADSVAETRRVLGGTLVDQGRPDEALPLLDSTLAHWRGQQRGLDLANAQLTRAKALRRLDRGSEAEADLQAAQRYFETEKNLRFLEAVLAERAELEAQRSRWEPAYLARSRQLQLQRELEALRRDELSASLRVQFESARKEQENLALQRESVLREAALRDAQRIRQLQAGLLVLAVLLVLGLLVYALRKRRHAAHMQGLALTDVLTGLPNRRAILQQLSTALQAGASGPVLMFDIDHFKAINDALGHDVGDQVLREVAAGARAALGADGVVGRIGGEEFLVLLKPGSALPALAERLRSAVAALRFGGAAAALPRVTISLGGGPTLAGETAPETVLKRVDEALYRAKQGGRNRFELLGQ